MSQFAETTVLPERRTPVDPNSSLQFIPGALLVKSCAPQYLSLHNPAAPRVYVRDQGIPPPPPPRAGPRDETSAIVKFATEVLWALVTRPGTVGYPSRSCKVPHPLPTVVDRLIRQSGVSTACILRALYYVSVFPLAEATRTSPYHTYHFHQLLSEHEPKKIEGIAWQSFTIALIFSYSKLPERERLPHIRRGIWSNLSGVHVDALSRLAHWGNVYLRECGLEPEPNKWLTWLHILRNRQLWHPITPNVTLPRSTTPPINASSSKETTTASSWVFHDVALKQIEGLITGITGDLCIRQFWLVVAVSTHFTSLFGGEVGIASPYHQQRLHTPLPKPTPPKSTLNDVEQWQLKEFIATRRARRIKANATIRAETVVAGLTSYTNYLTEIRYPIPASTTTSSFDGES